MRALITGSRGFVGGYLRAELSAHGYTVFGIDLAEDENTSAVDLMDAASVRKHIREVRPDALFHLAAQASVPLSWKEPQITFSLNIIGAVNLLEALRAEIPSCRTVIVGSSDQYGAVASSSPVSEDMPLCPQNPYAVSKRAQEDIARVYAGSYSMDIRLTRSFNHSGPGQRLGFLVSDLCKGIVRVERGLSKCMKVGNLESVRDFTDVRDVARAYRLVAEKGGRGEIYNVGSGTGIKARDILDMLLSMSGRSIPVVQDPERVRPSDTPVLICDNAKLRADTGWESSIPIEKTLKDTLEYYRREELLL